MTKTDMKLRIQTICTELNKFPPIFLSDKDIRKTLKELEKELEFEKMLRMCRSKIKLNGYEKQQHEVSKYGV